MGTAMGNQLVGICLLLLLLDIILIWRLWVAQRVRKDFQAAAEAHAAGYRLIRNKQRGGF